ncbi:peptidase S1 [Maricaulis maris]|uniref:peptidase S1 n=1 Tax=Maricaulis maris TaxID=74318 RepID=UPI003B8B4286
MFMKSAATAIVAAAAFAGLATAQDYSLSPNFGEVSLSAGFAPDPYGVSIVAGGSVNASNVGCAGSISNAPDVRLYWSGGAVTIGAESGSDTTLVINAPDGSWYCADDVNGLDPAIRLSGSGQYDIWVGVYGGGTANAVVYFTEF